MGCRRPAKVVIFDTLSGKAVASIGAVGDTDDLFHDGVRALSASWNPPSAPCPSPPRAVGSADIPTSPRTGEPLPSGIGGSSPHGRSRTCHSWRLASS